MSKLQCNFTTLEQSKRLIELGLPVDSADCYYTAYGLISVIMPTTGDIPFLREIGCTPCWSVGRLIEIYGFGTNQYIGNIWYRNPMECIIADIEIAIENGEMDFSKLRE